MHNLDLSRLIIKITVKAFVLMTLAVLASCQMPSYQSGGLPSLPGGSTTITPPSSSKPSGSQGSSGGQQSPGGNSSEIPSSPTGESRGSENGASVEELDDALEDSLDGFDSTLESQGNKKTMDEIDILSPSGSATVQGDDEIAPLSETGELTIENEDYNTESQPSAKPDSAKEQANTSQQESGSPSEDSPDSSPTVPEDIGDGQGDDIVLRQIREAALKETNPVLREKLWDEYRKIKGI